MLNQSLFTAQSGDYSQITSLITLANAQHFASIYQALANHASVCTNPLTNQSYTLLDYVQQGICVAIGGNYPLDAIATLKGLNLIVSSDNVHIGLTPLGYDYYNYIQA